MRDVKLTDLEVKLMIEKIENLANFTSYLQKNKGKDSLENLIRKYISKLD
jgi:hypothetical protein